MGRGGGIGELEKLERDIWVKIEGRREKLGEKMGGGVGENGGKGQRKERENLKGEEKKGHCSARGFVIFFFFYLQPPM